MNTQNNGLIINSNSYVNPLTQPNQTTNILAHHLEEWVVKSAVNDDIARLNVRSMDSSTAVKHLGFDYRSPIGGWWTAGVSPLSGRPKEPPYGQFKPDVPVDLGGKKPAKYLTAKGQKPDAIWLAMPDENYWMDVMDNADAIFITEGAKKAGAGLSIGLPTVAFTGVYNWVGDGIQQLAEHFGRFVSQSGSKTYYIAFDSDYETKPECVKAILMLGKALKKAGIKDVRVITWSQDYKGMDDYIKANGGDEFKKRVDMAVKIKEWEKQFKDDDDDIDSGKKRPRQNSKTVADDLVEKHRNDWAYHNEQKVWRIWNGKYWEEIDGDAFSQLVLNELEVKEVKISNPGFLKNVVEFLRLKLLVKKWLTFDRKRYIPFNNGVLDLGENKLLPHDTGYRFTHCLNRDYSPIESSGDILSDLKRHHPYGYDYIMQAASGHVDAALKMLAVLAGIVKWRFSELQKFVYIQGKPRSGKGTFIRLVTELIGRKNTQSSCLNKLSSEYEVAEIIDSQLVVFPDEDKQGGGYSVFKKLTGGDELRYRPIYGKPAKSNFDGSILICSNGSIFAGDATGIKERQCTLLFDNQVDEGMRSPLFEERLHKDIDKLLAVVLSMPDDEIDARIKGLYDHGFAMYREREWQLRCDVNGVAAFIEDKLKPSKDGFIVSSDLFEQYSYYCDDNKYGKTQKNKMTGELISTINSYLHWENVESKTKRVDGKATKIVTGITWRGDDDDFVSQTLATESKEMAQVSEPLPQTAVTSPPVTAEALPLETTEKQGVEPNVTAVTAESQLFEKEKFKVDWGEDEPIQLDLMATPKAAPDKTDEIIDRLINFSGADEFKEIVKTYKPSQLNNAHNALIENLIKFPDNGKLANLLIAIKYFKGELDKEIEKEKEDCKKRLFLKKLGNKASTGLVLDVELNINSSRYQGKGKMLGHGAKFGTYDIFPVNGYSQGIVVRFEEITIPAESWDKIKW